MSDAGDGKEWTILHDGRLMVVHGRDQCAGEFCCIHNPSDHPLRHRPLNWRWAPPYDYRRIMERICEHGVGHPDPDDVKVRSSSYEGIHGCDGCCSRTRGSTT